MSRNDLDIKDLNQQKSIIDECKICRVGIHDTQNNEIYIVPMNFGYDYDNTLTLYFHGSPSGRKYELLKNGANIGFQMDTGYELKPGDNACSYTASYKSVIGNGRISLIHDENGKINALNKIMHHYTKKPHWDYNPKYFSYVAVYKLEVTKLSIREHK